MDNENKKWEYDYSALYNNTASTGDTGYVNVGSSGTNAANQYNAADGTTGTPAAQPAAEPAAPAAAADSAATDAAWNRSAADNAQHSAAPSGGTTGYAGGYYGSAAPQPKPRRSKKTRTKIKWGQVAKKILAKTVSLALVGAVGFGGGWLGAAMNPSGGRVVVQTVERNPSTSAGTTSAAGSDLTLAQVSALVSPSVVVITTEAMVSTGSWFGVGQVQSGAGSGVIISEDGYILTCAHVISGAANIIVTIDDVDYTANLIGEDAESDIAVIKIEASGLVPAVMADSDTLVVGEEVVAVGNPLGELGGTVTNGIVSALNRNVVVDNTEMTLIQTNASVSPGNSGGGLFNMAGELIGIVNAKSADEDAEGLGFAIPVNTALQVARDLLENGYVSGRPALGVTVLEINDVETAAHYGVSSFGVYIADLTKGGGADKAGLQVGDRIVAINDTEVVGTDDLTGVIAECAVGDVVTLSIARNGKLLTVEVTLGDRNASNTQSSSSSRADPFQIPGFGGDGRG